MSVVSILDTAGYPGCPSPVTDGQMESTPWKGKQSVKLLHRDIGGSIPPDSTRCSRSSPEEHQVYTLSAVGSIPTESTVIF
jgi:hypothetical protein